MNESMGMICWVVGHVWGRAKAGVKGCRRCGKTKNVAVRVRKPVPLPDNVLHPTICPVCLEPSLDDHCVKCGAAWRNLSEKAG